ncbi:hypothetical protein [Halalkalicoccus ordinarius]|uniref:hypothetical protein n=1 Tax=Halalkalicoccus ordinarius TaxID=3116651 RepID=UPI00300EB36C
MERPERIPREGEEEFDCIRCSATFLSEEALQRHYDWNPEHAEPVTLDARGLEEEGTKLEDSAWVEFDDRIETFLTVAEDANENALEMTYRPEEGSVLVDGPREQTIDVSEVQERASDRIRWSFNGTYYKLAFLKGE